MTQTEPSSQRKQLEQAIAVQESLRGTVDNAIIDATIATLRKELAILEPAPIQQRKQVTLLFMDVVGSTSIVRDLDPEDSLAILDTALKRLSLSVDEYGGQVTRYMGDGFMSVFGHPAVHENDPDRAVLAGLAILKAAQKYAKEVEGQWGIKGFNVRVGINTGLVVIGGQSEAEDTIMGAAVNLAARLESAAEPGTLLISHSTYQNVRGAFDLQALEPITAKGFAEPVPVYCVLQAKARSFRTRRRGVEGVETRMVGREAEFHQLQKTFQEVIDKEKRLMVTLVGEAGIGKSRMLYEFENWVDLQPEGVALYRGRARLENQHHPYGLLRDLFAFRFEIRDDDPIQLVREKIVNGFQETFGTGESTEMKAHFSGLLLGYDIQESRHLAKVRDAQQIHDRALVYLTDYFKTAASEEPVLVLLEDLHWADDSSLVMLARLTLALSEKPVMVLGAARPSLYERWPNWVEGQPFHARLDLQPLSGEDSLNLLEEVLQKVDDVPAALKELVVSKTEGNPFYMEELVKMLVEDGVILKGEERWQVFSERLGDVHVPTTLTGILQARLEALPEMEQSVLQGASVVGRVFWDAVLTYLYKSSQAEVGEDAVLQALELLREKEIIYRQEPSAFVGANEHIFNHALLREVTYESVLKRLRRDYHGLVADWLIEQSGERLGEFTGLIADHLESAERKADALFYLQKAGEAAAAKYANEEAIDYYTRGLKLITDNTMTTRYELLQAREKLYHRLGQRLEQQQDLKALDDLAKDSGQVVKQMEVALQWVKYYEVTGDYQPGILKVEKVVEQAEKTSEVSLAARGLHMWGVLLMKQGHYETARERFDKALVGFQKAGDRYDEGKTLNNLGGIAFYQGDFPTAQNYYRRAMEISLETGNRRGEGYGLNNLGNIATEQGDYATAWDFYQSALTIYREIGDRFGEELALGNLGNAALYRGEALTGRDYYEQAMEIASEIGDQDGEGWALQGLGEVLVVMGEPEQAGIFYRKAVILREELGQQHLAMVSRAGLARALLALGDVSEAMSHVEPILDFLHTGRAPGSYDPMIFYVNCVQVLNANNDLRAGKLLEMAYSLLQERAAKIQDEELRRSFFENVPGNKEIVKLWEARG